MPMSTKRMPYDRKVITANGDIREPNPRDMCMMLIGEVKVIREQVDAMQQRLIVFNQYMSNTKGWDDE